MDIMNTLFFALALALIFAVLVWLFLQYLYSKHGEELMNHYSALTTVWTTHTDRETSMPVTVMHASPADALKFLSDRKGPIILEAQDSRGISTRVKIIR